MAIVAIGCTPANNPPESSNLGPASNDTQPALSEVQQDYDELDYQRAVQVYLWPQQLARADRAVAQILGTLLVGVSKVIKFSQPRRPA